MEGWKRKTLDSRVRGNDGSWSRINDRKEAQRIQIVILSEAKDLVVEALGYC